MVSPMIVRYRFHSAQSNTDNINVDISYIAIRVRICIRRFGIICRLGHVIDCFSSCLVDLEFASAGKISPHVI